MKLSAKVILFILLMFTASHLFSLGLMFFSNNTTQVFALDDYSVDVRIENQVAVTTVVETFRNSTFQETSPIYAFPMPADASATQLIFTVNGVTEVATLQGGDQPGNPGQGSGFGEQINSYLGTNPLVMPFTDTDVAQGSEMIMSLTYVQMLPYSDGDVTFTYPSAPFLFHNNPIPHGVIDLELFSERTIMSVNIVDGICEPVINEEQNYAHIVWDCENLSGQNSTELTYELNAEEVGMFGLSTMVNPANIPDSDDNGFFLFVAEPDPNNEALIMPKMFTLIIDNSGSMSGSKITQAKDAARYIVNNFNDNDLFNIVRFNSSASTMSQQMLPVNATNLNTAHSFINSISAGGGTNIEDAFDTAIPLFIDPDNEYAKIIIFLTDGEATVGITNTTQLVSHIDTLINNTTPELCLFTFGIGSSVNTSLLTQTATNHNGFPAFLGNDILEEVITEFYNKVRNPVLLNPTITVEPDVLSNVYPDPLPSIYIGNQMLIAGRYNDPGLITVILSGTAFGQQINYTYDYTLSDQINTDYSFLTKIWAKNMLENLILDYYLLNPNSSQAIQLRQEIINLSISWGVMCEFTHYTSIDEPIQDEDEFPETEEATLCVKLLGNFPNPFNPNTTIKFEVLKAINESAVVKIYNIKGELVKILIVDVRGAGIYEINWNGTDKQLKSVASGTYFYTISLDNSILAGKMVMLK